MKILMVASEATPYAKTGGLADVIGALPSALAARGEEVGVVLPLYKAAASQIGTAERLYNGMPVVLNASLTVSVDIKRVVDRGISVFLVDCPSLYDRDALYGEDGKDYPDNHIRFAVLCRAALGVVRSLFRPDIIHSHDWQASLIGPYARHHFRLDPTLTGIKILLTIHNLGYQGLFPREALAEIGLSKDLYRSDLLEFWGRFNLLKGGILFADAISTVSPTYAREIQTEEQGFGLEGLLRSRSDVLTGILNGVDYSEWSPQSDRYIAANYTANDLSGKQKCKADLLRTMGLLDGDLNRPLIGVVSRFVHQKGFDIMEPILDQLLQREMFFIALGTGDPHFEGLMTSLAERYPDKVAVRVSYDDELAHKIEAGADIFLMPSHYEPCGLNQMYSLRYGTVPVVRATGGLDDTIDESTGFKFREYSAQALLGAMEAALDAWRDRKLWTSLMTAGMLKDYSWNASAAEYIALYRRIVAL